MNPRERAYAEVEAAQILAAGAGAPVSASGLLPRAAEGAPVSASGLLLDLRSLAREAPGAAKELNALAARLEAGAKLHEALAAAPKLFPGGLREVVRAVGPRGLRAALDRTAWRRRGLDMLVDAYIRPLVYPLAVAAMISFVAASFERFVVPTFNAMGVSAGVPMAAAMDAVFAVFLLGFLLAAVAAGAALSERPGRATILLAAARVFPGAGAAWARLEAGLALRDVAAYLRAGVGLAEALTAAAAGTEGAALRGGLVAAAQKALAGASGAEALGPVLPPGAADALAVGGDPAAASAGAPASASSERAPLPDALDETGAWLAERALASGAKARNAVHLATVLAAATLASLVLFAAYAPIFGLGEALPL